ncbi:MAG: polysaccharide deacetylase family protein [Actinomycetota bacterium]|nr:polysaccharide deacetylase family protein [Actinomycetota bacterium]
MLRSGASLMVLGWHNVEGTWCFPAAPGACRRGLEQQLTALRRLTTIVPLRWALHALDEGRPLPPRALSITFDDGYRDTLTLAGPLLRKLGVPATCFLVPGLLSGEIVPWWEELAWAFTSTTVDRLEHHGQILVLGSERDRRSACRTVSEQLKQRDRREREAAVEEIVTALAPTGDRHSRAQFLDWDGARQLQEYMDIGSHSRYHAILSRETAAAQQQDLADSRRQLADRLGAPIDVLAYPNGTTDDFGTETLAAAEQAGYTHAVTTERGLNTHATPRYEIRRCVMNPERGAVELGKIVQDLALRARRRGRVTDPEGG